MAMAESLPQPRPAQSVSRSDPQEPDYLSLSAGYVGVLRDAVGTAYSIEYRLHQNYLNIHPAVMLGWTEHSKYVNISLQYTQAFGERWFCTLSSGPGSYSRDSDGQNLGAPLEFLSSIEVAREIGRGQRLALGFEHISNAHVARLNPGNEMVRLSYILPIYR
ncbi:MAG: acyloxyacyl hydrolase [Steroidobacteraceae bacterium]